jgi:hypothetical protein
MNGAIVESLDEISRRTAVMASTVDGFDCPNGGLGAGHAHDGQNCRSQ